MVISLSPINTIMPIIAFLFVFVLIYALLMKTKVIGDNSSTAILLALIIASFFIVNVQIVEFTKLSVSWIVVFIVCVFIIMLVLAFVGDKALKVFTENKGFAGALVLAVILVFVFSSSYVFNWAINWDLIQSWFDQPWFGMTVLVVLAGIISAVLTKK